MSIATLTRRAKQVMSDHSPAILAGAGIAGTVVTAILSGRAGYKAGYQMAQEDDTITTSAEDQTKKERYKHVAQRTWKLYMTPAVSGVGTVVAIAAGNKVSTGRTAAMAAAYSITDKAFTDYKAKTVEVLGEKKEQTDIRDKIAQDQVSSTGERGSLVILNSGEVLCYDSFTDRYFNSSMERLKKAQNDTNYQILHNVYVSLSEFYDKIGLPPTSYSDELGWTSDNLLELHFTTVMTPDDRPALSFNFHVDPVRNYDRVHGA